MNRLQNCILSFGQLSRLHYYRSLAHLLYEKQSKNLIIHKFFKGIDVHGYHCKIYFQIFPTNFGLGLNSIQQKNLRQASHQVQNHDCHPSVFCGLKKTNF